MCGTLGAMSGTEGGARPTVAYSCERTPTVALRGQFLGFCESPSGWPFPERIISLSREVAGRRQARLIPQGSDLLLSPAIIVFKINLGRSLV